MDICDARRRCFRDFIHKHALCVSAPAAFEALLPPTVPTMSCAPALPCVDNPRVRSARDVPAAPAASPLGQTLPDLRGIAQQVRAHTPCPRKRVVGDMAHLLLVLRAPARTPRPRKRVVVGGRGAKRPMSPPPQKGPPRAGVPSPPKEPDPTVHPEEEQEYIRSRRSRRPESLRSATRTSAGIPEWRRQ